MNHLLNKLIIKSKHFNQKRQTQTKIKLLIFIVKNKFKPNYYTWKNNALNINKNTTKNVKKMKIFFKIYKNLIMSI